MKLNDTIVELTKNSVRVDGSLMTLPFSHSGVLIDKSSSYIKVTAKLGLVAKWNEDDSFTVELDMMYQNKTCGLCGDFNGIQLHNEFIKKGKSCPYHNMVHQECGNPCINTCSNPDRGHICKDDCFNGCFCPAGYLFDDLTGRGCIAKNKCPCIHNGKTYKPGQTYRSNCKECTCKDRKWQCTTDLCHGTCTVYGDGHYITFDGKRYTFDGDCEYTLIRDYCGHANASGTFRVLTENIPCGTTGTTCSKAVRVFLGNKEFKLTDGGYQILHRDEGVDIPYQIWKRGIYMVIEANNGLIVMWDQRTNMFIKLSPNFKGTVCGLCGNYDGNANNDFMLRSQKVVIKPLDFGNDWKETSSCPVAMEIRNPCSNNPYRELWAQKECSIIKSQVFTTCHSQVDPSHFYDACVRDSCACDSGGDRDCLCAAIAAYAQACNEAGTCVAWRTPKICRESPIIFSA
ncbi:Mucin-5B [Anabarilius grahami]|uniref:Mucin-5B n=1 Tax=Anabarilius grahami TaxID=495550 RepID=A0A3N0Y899_ANAGA|nr:Mucin-5B [Anabarilius grahami]